MHGSRNLKRDSKKELFLSMLKDAHQDPSKPDLRFNEIRIQTYEYLSTQKGLSFSNINTKKLPTSSFIDRHQSRVLISRILQDERSIKLREMRQVKVVEKIHDAVLSVVNVLSDQVAQNGSFSI